MKSESLISVIIPVYNGEKYLADCVGSVRKQTYRHLEIIIVNDGSVDKTGEICAGLQKQYDNIKVITLADEGVSAARNAGIEAAEGEFITFVDADDRLRPAMLQILYDCIQTTESDVAGCRFFIWKNEEDWKEADEAAKEAAERLQPETVRLYTPESYVEDAILQGNSRCWSKLYRREAVREIRFRTDFSVGEDMLFLTDMLASVRKLAEIPYRGYGYFQNPAGAICREFTPKYMDQIRCWESARDIIAKRYDGHGLYEQTTALFMMGIMLTAGKLAALSYDKRKAQDKYVRICHTKMKEAMAVAGAYKRLSAGYKIKTKLFCFAPQLYLLLYHFRKNA